MKPQEFISKVAMAAQYAAQQTGVPASISIAQAALESGWGESGLTKAGNNLFGIKADSKLVPTSSAPENSLSANDKI